MQSAEESTDPLEECALDADALPVAQLGDLWLLGTHRLLCANALQAESYAQLLDGERAQMVITDPPYNVPIQGHVCGSGSVKHDEFVMASGEMNRKEFTAFLSKMMQCTADASRDGAIHYYFMDWRHITELTEAARPVLGEIRQLCIWAKDNAGIGTFYRNQHEMVFVYKKGSAPHINNFELGQHGRYRTNVWNYPGVNTFSGKGYALLKYHPTVKPVAMIADAIRDCSHHSGRILDPFAGSGTIVLAAERTNRVACAMELEPKYIDVAIQRWQHMTGQHAVLAQSGLTWGEVRAHRTTESSVGEYQNGEGA